MKKLIIFFIVLILAVWVGLLMHADQGYMLISYGHWSIETTLWAAIIAIVVLFFALYIVGRFINAIFLFSGRVRRWSSRKRRTKARKLTNRGLCDLHEGAWQQAEKNLAKAAEHSDTPLINYLSAARSAHGGGEFDKRDAYLKLAAESTAGAEVAVGLTQAQLQLDAGQLEQALATLRHLNQIAPRHKYVMTLLVEVYERLQDWHSLKELIPELRKRKVVDPDKLYELEVRVQLDLLKHAAQSQQLSALQTVWESIPKSMRARATLVCVYVAELVKHNASDQAELILRDVLKKHWYPDLVEQYGLAQGADPKKQLAMAEGWLKSHKDDPVLLLCLGRLCARNKLWGQAKDYLEACLKLQANQAASFELAAVYEQLGEKDKALACYRDAVAS